MLNQQASWLSLRQPAQPHRLSTLSRPAQWHLSLQCKSAVVSGHHHKRRPGRCQGLIHSTKRQLDRRVTQQVRAPADQILSHLPAELDPLEPGVLCMTAMMKSVCTLPKRSWTQ
uniref:Uncharacterized protein n=1 Tax=Vitrella brassicaformis TaxID=1169539 RepID=A0A7S1KID6_9ALVE